MMGGVEPEMTNSRQESPQKAIIASVNPLFGRGLEKLLLHNWGNEGIRVRLTSTLEETLTMMDHWKPNLVIVDYDDHTIHRHEFLNHFVNGENPMQVMLVSLQASGAVVVYDRRTLTADQVEAWLNPAAPAEKTEQRNGDSPDKQNR